MNCEISVNKIYDVASNLLSHYLAKCLLSQLDLDIDARLLMIIIPGQRVEAPKTMEIETSEASMRGGKRMVEFTVFISPADYHSQSGAKLRPQRHFGELLVAKMLLIAAIFTIFVQEKC